VTVLLGTRHDQTKSSVLNNLSDGRAVCQPAGNGVCGSIEASKWLSRAGASYHWTEHVIPYVAYSESYFPQASTTSSGINLPPEAGKQYEAGVKGILFSGRLLLTSSIFKIDRLTNAPTNEKTNGFTPLNERHRGFEIEVVGRPTQGWSLSAQYSYIDAHTKLADPTVTGITVGNVPFLVAKHNAGLLTTYELQSGPLRGFAFGGGARYLSKRFLDLGDQFEYPSLTLADVVLQYTPVQRYLIQFNIKNVFDKEYYLFSSYADQKAGQPRGDRREFDLGVTVRL